MDRRLSLLFSLVALPACEDGTADNPRTPDGGDPANFVNSCKALYESYLACYEDMVPEYDSSGSYATGYGEEYLDEICQQTRESLEQEYGLDCVAGLEEVYACIASIDCKTLLDDGDDGSGFDVCNEVFIDAHSKCPEVISFCSSNGVGGTSACEFDASDCLDGNSYGVRCDESGGATVDCTCLVGGEAVRDVVIDGAIDCFEGEARAEVAVACGFPEGVF